MIGVQLFRCGDTVTWRSQAAGIWREKTGQVIAVVPAGSRPNDTFQALGMREHMKGAGWQRDHVSYVVRAGGRLYWPRVSALTPASSAPCPHCNGTGKAVRQ